MGFFNKFKRIIKSNLNDMISKAEDPEKMLNQIIIDMNQQLVESKKGVATAIADEKKLERQMNNNFTLAGEWEHKAKLAVQAGKDDLAKEALIRKQEYAGLAAQYKEQWEDQHESVEQLKQALRQLQQKIEEAQRKRNLLLARAKRATAQKRIQETVGQFSNNSAFDAFDRMSSKIDELEAENEARKEIEDTIDLKTDPLEKQFEALESSTSSADLMLEDLKQRMKEDSAPSS